MTNEKQNENYIISVTSGHTEFKSSHDTTNILIDIYEDNNNFFDKYTYKYILDKSTFDDLIDKIDGHKLQHKLNFYYWNFLFNKYSYYNITHTSEYDAINYIVNNYKGHNKFTKNIINKYINYMYSHSLNGTKYCYNL